MNRNSFLKLLFVSIILITTIGWIGWKFYIGYEIKRGKKYYNEIRNYPKYYSYDTMGGILKGVKYIENIGKDGKALEIYYDSLWRGYNPFFGFPIKYVPIFKRVYILGHPNKRDSLLSEFVDFDTICYGYIHGYVYSSSLHKDYPPDDLVKKFNVVWDSIKGTKDYKMKDAIISHRNPYGAHCDCNQ